MSNWQKGTVVDIVWWTDKLFTIKVAASIAPFRAGQFTKLALLVGEKRVARAYSFVNSPNAEHHEFYLIEVDDGLLSPPLASLKIGDEIEIENQPSGFFTLDEVPDSEQLWLLSTGTAIGPFLSILSDGQVWSRFKHVVLVHGVRLNIDLTYQHLINEVADKYVQFQYLPVVSRDNASRGLNGRITQVLDSGELESTTGLAITPQLSQFMVCGNPQMVKDCTSLLMSRGLIRNRRSSPGHITVEQYW